MLCSDGNHLQEINRLFQNTFLVPSKAHKLVLANGRQPFVSWLPALALVLVMSTQIYADIALPKIFSDHMVLQRERSMRVWGTAEPKQELMVKLSDQEVATVADAQGNWAAVISTGPAGGPFQLEIKAVDESTKVLFSNVLVGEVWICGGESNMQMTVGETENADVMIEAAKRFPKLRLFNVAHHAANEPLEDFAKVDPWFCCSSDTVRNFSAIGYCFGCNLQQALQVPVGIINVSRSATTIEAWTPYLAVEKDGSFTELLNHWKENNAPNNPNRISNSFNGMIAPLTRFPVAGVNWYQGETNVGRGAQYRRLLPLMIKSWRKQFQSPELPFLFVQLAPYRYEDHSRSALPEIWDAQLETFKSVANCGMIVSGDIGDLESVTPSNKIPVAQRLSRWALANYYQPPKPANSNKGKESTTESNSSAAESPNQPEPASDAQRSSVQLNEPEQQPGGEDAANLASSLDQPQASDQSPRQLAESNQQSIEGGSQLVEEKLEEDKTLTSTAQPKVNFCGPIYRSFKIEGDRIIVSFSNADSGLFASDSTELHITICGDDREFKAAETSIEGSRLILRNPDISKPIAVRYAWHDTAESTLFSRQGLPASPFRTDDFPLSSEGTEF